MGKQSMQPQNTGVYIIERTKFEAEDARKFHIIEDQYPQIYLSIILKYYLARKRR